MPEVCFKDCVEYGNTGGWVTVEVQDKYGERVTGYLGDGLRRDPGDEKGNPDNAKKYMLDHIHDIEKEMYKILKEEGV